MSDKVSEFELAKAMRHVEQNEYGTDADAEQVLLAALKRMRDVRKSGARCNKVVVIMVNDYSEDEQRVDRMTAGMEKLELTGLLTRVSQMVWGD